MTHQCKNILKTILFIPVFLVMTGCVGPRVTFPTVAAQDISDGAEGRKISASAGGFQLLLLIPIALNDRHERAYRALKRKARGDLITNIEVVESWHYGFVGTGYRTTLTAMAYPSKNAKPEERKESAIRQNW